MLLALAALQTIGTVVRPVLVPYLHQRLTLCDAQAGLLTSAFALAISLASIPMGLASSRWGGRMLYAAAAFLARRLFVRSRKGRRPAGRGGRRGVDEAAGLRDATLPAG